MIKRDGCFDFGLGVFETIDVRNGSPIFLDKHINRINNGIKVLDLDQNIDKKIVLDYISENKIGFAAVKLVVSKENIVLSSRANNYSEEDYLRGFKLRISKVLRNETSKLTFIKSTSYADNILERAEAIKNGFDDALFLNSKGQICETSVANIYFVKGNKIYTPKKSCGLLDGTIRQYLMENFNIIEGEIYLEDIKNYEEAFISNSLMGIMSVRSIGDFTFNKMEIFVGLRDEYERGALNGKG